MQRCGNAVTEVCTRCYRYTGETVCQHDTVSFITFQLLSTMPASFGDVILSTRRKMHIKYQYTFET